MESAQEIAEPLAEAEVDEEDETEEIAETGTEIEDEETENVEEPEVKDELEEPQSKSKRGDRSRRGRKKSGCGIRKEQIAKSIRKMKMQEDRICKRRKTIRAPLFEIEDSDFERIVDDEETTGDMFKDAYMQEAIIDQVRAIEFDMESAATAEVGSLIGSFGENEHNFERIADEDEQTEEISKPKKGRGNRGGKGRSKSTKRAEEMPKRKKSVTEA